MERILCIGDSNTYGYDPRGWGGGRYPNDVRWTGLLRSAGLRTVNLGQNGLCIPREEAFPALAELLRSLQPFDAVTVMLGGNDLLQGANAAQAAARMEALLRFLCRQTESARIILICPPPVQPGTWVPDGEMMEETARLGPLYRALAGRLGVRFADAGDWGVELSFDGVHFTEAGHAAFARALRALLEAEEERPKKLGKDGERA